MCIMYIHEEIILYICKLKLTVHNLLDYFYQFYFTNGITRAQIYLHCFPFTLQATISVFNNNTYECNFTH